MIRSDLELIDSVKNTNDSNSFIELSKRHTPLCHTIYNKYSNYIYSSGVCLEDVKDEKDLVIYKAILSFDPSRNIKFSTWLGNNVKFQCLNSITNNGKYIAMESEELTKKIDNKTSESFIFEENKENKEFIFNILSQLKDERVYKVFESRYFSNPNKKTAWSKIAKNIGISTQTAINLHKRGIKLLKNKMSSQDLQDNI